MNEKEYSKQIDEALELRKSGKIQESIAVLSKIYKTIPANDTKSLGLVGSLFREASELSKALYCFRKELKANPRSPRASLGWFLSLWRLERYDEAFDELERFFSFAKDKEHLQLLKKDGEHFRLLEDMREEFFGNTLYKSEVPLSLIKKLREDLHNHLDDGNTRDKT